MNIQSTQLSRPTFQPVKVNSESSTFGLDFDPFRGVKKAIEDTVELGTSFVTGAVPGVGAMNLFQRGFSASWNGRGANSKLGFGGSALNAVGTVGLLVGAGQHAFGGDPSIALGISVASLAGSGIASALLTART